MVRTFVAGLALVSLLFVSTACASGPKRLGRSWDDHVNQKYTENAWVHGALLQDILPVYGFVGLLAGLGDAFVNVYYFWSTDAWDNKGTGYEHKTLAGADKTVSGSGL